MVGAIKGSTQKEPMVVGKPSTFMMSHLASEYDFSFHFQNFALPWARVLSKASFCVQCSSMPQSRIRESSSLSAQSLS